MAFYTHAELEAFADWLFQEQAAALEAAAASYGAGSMRQSHRFNRAAAALGALHDYRVFRGRADGVSPAEDHTPCDHHPGAPCAGQRRAPWQCEENQQ